jgi:hypothetical protein
MLRKAATIGLLLGLAALGAAPRYTAAQQNETPKRAVAVKAGKGQRVCRVRLKYTGEIRTWVCKKEEPCCVWHEISYVKCGSTIFGCL